MSAFFEFGKAHPWQVGIMIFVVASYGFIFGWIIANVFANGRIGDIIRDLHNPANVSKRIERKAKGKKWLEPDPDLVDYVEKGAPKR